MKFNPTEHGKFLMYWRPITRYVCEKNQITMPDLEMLLFLYGVGFFKRSDFKDFEACYPFDKHRFNRLLSEGWFYKWLNGGGNKPAIYDMTQKGKMLVFHLYEKLLGNEDVSVLRAKLPSRQKKSNHMRAVRKGLIDRINTENRQLRQTHE